MALDFLIVIQTFFHAMDPLFTFNSHQLRPPSPHPSVSLPRKSSATSKPINCHSRETVREAGITSHRSATRPRHCRRPSIQREKEDRQGAKERGAQGGELGPAANKSGKKMKEGKVDHFMFSFRYSHQPPAGPGDAPVRGRTTLQKRKPKLTENTLAECSIQQQWLFAEAHPRRRIQSVKMSPRIVVPLSDRKLPKVFKVRQQDCLPPIDPVRKYDSLELRQVRSAHRARCGFPHRLREELQQLGGLVAEVPSLVLF